MTRGWVHSRDPWTGEEVGRWPATPPEEVVAGVARARAAGRDWARVPLEARARALRAFAGRLEADRAELAALITAEVGKRRADAEAEVNWTAASARFYAEHPPPEHPAGGARVLRRPLGVVAAVTPWNVPLVTPAWKWLPALMAGNAVVWKPSERASATALAAREHLVAAGVAPGAITVITGGPEAARALAADPGVDGLHFTGSERAGRALAALASERGARTALELSGHNPAVVLEDADLDLAADCIVACATALAGQKCTATRRVLVAEQRRDALAERLAARVEALEVGDPRDPATDVGPLIDAEARSRAEAAVAASLRGGAGLLARAPAPARPAVFAPVLLAGLAPKDPLRRNELFAPVLLLEAFARPADAWAAADESGFGLAAAVYGRDPAGLEEAAGELRLGVVAVNRRGDDVALEAPFAGRGRSGDGRAEGGTWGYDAVTALQAVYGA